MLLGRGHNTDSEGITLILIICELRRWGFRCFHFSGACGWLCRSLASGHFDCYVYVVFFFVCARILSLSFCTNMCFFSVWKNFYLHLDVLSGLSSLKARET